MIAQVYELTVCRTYSIEKLLHVFAGAIAMVLDYITFLLPLVLVRAVVILKGRAGWMKYAVCVSYGLPITCSEYPVRLWSQCKATHS